MSIQKFRAEVEAMTPQELLNTYMENVSSISLSLLGQAGQMRQKPLLGGPFGNGGYVVASNINWGSLHSVSYYVMERESRLAFSISEVKVEAIEHARLMLKKHGLRLQSEFARFKVAAADRVAADRAKQEEAWEKHRQEVRAALKPATKRIPRRRRQIFDESDGKCHYCGIALTLDGRWHVEHKMPKALGGGNEPSNLVASCAPCNHSKLDTTDIEFKAKLAKKEPA